MSSAFEIFKTKYPRFSEEFLDGWRNRRKIDLWVSQDGESIHFKCSLAFYNGNVTDFKMTYYKKPGKVAKFINDFDDTYLWNEKGEAFVNGCYEQVEGDDMEIPFQRFLEIGEKDGYEVVEHKSIYEVGTSLVEKIEKLMKEDAKKGKRRTHKQLMQDISDIISKECDDPKKDLVRSYQDDTDYGFTSDEEDSY